MIDTSTAKKTDKELANEKSERVMNGVAFWSSFYRYNPHRFCKDFLNIGLKLFQKILIYAMMHNDHIMYIASRGLGKTWLIAVFCVIRCILFPGTKICVASATRTQGNEVLSKIMEELCKKHDWGSANLLNEISYHTISTQRAVIEFKNSSWIKVVTAGDTARGFRANILVLDEFRMVDKNIIKTVLKRFLTDRRLPPYLNNSEYKHLEEEEPNKEIYMTSAWYKSHWSYEKAKTFFVNSLDDAKKYFICGLPYQIAIKEHMLFRSDIIDEMSESDFDAMIFSMEMECLFFGDTEGAFFTFDDISKRRKLKTAVYPPTKSTGRNNRVPDLVTNEKRILSADIALMASTKNKNDASAIIINSAIPTKNNTYVANIIYLENHEGLTTDDLSLIIRRLYKQYKCTDLVLDTENQGSGVYDELIRDIYDPETGEVYHALSCCNDQEMANRCKIDSAPKEIWSIKASASFNTAVCLALRSGFQRGKLNLLIPEYEAKDLLREKIKDFMKLPINERVAYEMPYIQTSLLVNELIQLNHEVNGTNIRVFEKSGMRKDRYSSLSYNYWVQCQLERDLQKPSSELDVKAFADALRKINKKPQMVQ